jgi:hypothetical protein
MVHYASQKPSAIHDRVYCRSHIKLDRGSPFADLEVQFGPSSGLYPFLAQLGEPRKTLTLAPRLA